MTSRDLQKRCQYWQKRLRLDEWRIRVRFSDEIAAGGSYGECQWDAETREADIFVARGRVARKIAKQASAAVFWLQASNDAIEEATLKHELIHIVLDGHRPVTEHDNSSDREYAINRIAEALA